MSKTESRSIGYLFLQIALGIFFLVSGIWTLQGGKGNEIASAIRSVLNGGAANVCCIVFGVIEVIAGVFLILRLFAAVSASIDTPLRFVIMIAWVVAVLLIDFIGKGALPRGGMGSFLSWLFRLSNHLLVLGALLIVRG